MATSSARGQRGITLIEIVLWCAIVAAAVVAVFVFGKRAAVTAAVETEQRQVEDIVKTVDAIFATQPNFAALGTNGAVYLRERAARSGLKFETNEDGDPILTTGLGGGSLTLSSWDAVPPSGPAIPNSGYRLAYQGLASNECAKLVTATYPVAYQVSAGQDGLNDASATSLATRGQMTVSPADIAENCAAGEVDATVFLYFYPARAIAGATPTTPAPAARCNPVHETQSVACPAGQIGTITQERDGTCTGPGNTLVYTVWTTTNDTCAAPPANAIPAVVPAIPDDCALTTFSEVGSCATGQTGHILRTRTYDTCARTYTPWTVATDSCASPPAGATCTPSSRQQTIACPPGLSGVIVQSQSSSCPTANGAPVWPPSWNTVSNTCSGSPGMCTVQREVGPVPCGAGSYGPWTGERERFLNCINATTQSPIWTGYTVLTPNLSCVSCPPNITETSITWSADSAACPSGYTGSQDWEYETVRTRTVSYNCPAGTTTLPAATYGTWSSPTATGTIRNFIDNCAAATCTGSSTDTQTVATTGACPTGYTGNQTWDREQSRSRTCNAGTWSAWGAWSDTGTTNNFVDNCTPATCTGSSSETQWVPTTGACSAGYWGTPSWEREQMRSRTCTSGTWSAYGAWSDTGVTRNATGPCAACPASYTETGTQWVASSAACPAGYSGSNTWEREQTHSRSVSYSCPAGTTSSPAPSYGGWSGWTDTGSTRNTVNTCAPVAMCAVVVSNNYSVESGGDGRELASYSINGAWTNASCYERDHNCSPSSIFSVGAWAAACRSGDEYWLTSSPFGYTSTDWVNQVESVYHCQPCP